MRKIYGIAAVVAVLVVAGCQSAEVTQEPSPEVMDQDAMTPEPDPEPETIFITGEIYLDAESAVITKDGHCIPESIYAGRYLTELPGSQVLIRDAAGSIVATGEFEAIQEKEFCAWLLDAEIVPNSDFYSADFLGMSTAVASLADVEERVLKLDFVTPIAEQAEIDQKEAWPIDILPGNN